MSRIDANQKNESVQRSEHILAKSVQRVEQNAENGINFNYWTAK